MSQKGGKFALLPLNETRRRRQEAPFPALLQT